MKLCSQSALSSPSRSRPREGMKFNSQLREKFIYGQFWKKIFEKKQQQFFLGHDDEPDYNMDHSAYQQEYTPVRRNKFQKQCETLVFLQQEYPPPSYDYSQSSSPAAEKFLTSDPSTSFGFGGFSQVRSAGNKQLCNFVVFHVFAQLNCQKKN